MVFILSVILIVSACGAMAEKSYQVPESCKIFCEGPVLDAVQRAHIFPDSKHFVDMPMVYDPDTTLNAFEQITNKSDANLIREFVSNYFTDPGTELAACQQADWMPEPKAFDKIHDPVYRQWAYSIHAKWRTLCRRVLLSLNIVTQSLLQSIKTMFFRVPVD